MDSQKKTEKIEFNLARNFGEKINVTFTYISRNFKSLSLSLIYILAPVMLIGGMAFGYLMEWYFRLIGTVSTGGEPDFSVDEISTLATAGLAIFFVSVVAGTLIVTVAYSHMMIYKETDLHQITVLEVWGRTKKEFSGILGTYIGINVIFLFGAAIIGGIVIGVPIALDSFFLIGIGFIGFFILIIYFAIAVSLTLVIKVNEKLDFFSIIQRSLQLIRGKWWSTFGLLLIMQMIAGMLSYVFAIPFYILMAANMFHSIEQGGIPFESMQNMGIAGIASYTILIFGSYLLYALPVIALAFQYYNLVEMKEARGLMDKIESLGAAEKSDDADEDF